MNCEDRRFIQQPAGGGQTGLCSILIDLRKQRLRKGILGSASGEVRACAEDVVTDSTAQLFCGCGGEGQYKNVVHIIFCVVGAMAQQSA